MGERIKIVCPEMIDEGFLTQIRSWADEVLERASFPKSLPVLHLMAWKNMDKYLAFSRIVCMLPAVKNVHHWNG